MGKPKTALALGLNRRMPNGRGTFAHGHARNRETDTNQRFAVKCTAILFATLHGLFGLFVAVVAHVGDPMVGGVCAALGMFVVLFTYRISRLLHLILQIVALLVTSIAALIANVFLAEALT